MGRRLKKKREEKRETGKLQDETRAAAIKIAQIVLRPAIKRGRRVA